MRYDEFWLKMYKNLRTKREFETLRRNTLFSAHSENSSIIITPKKSKFPRSITREKFKLVWNHASKLSVDERFKPGNYSKITHNSAYEVTLMYEFLKK
jgi:hypothetical protein